MWLRHYCCPPPAQLHAFQRAEACALAAETAASLLALGVPREAEKALKVLLSAVEARAATATLVQAVVDFLRRSEHAPLARFEPGSG